jgi:hypothetical protein
VIKRPRARKCLNLLSPLSVEAGVNAALGSTNSNNANQLGNKLTTGISNQLKNQAINKTEGLVNDKANKFLNIFGAVLYQ